MIATKRLFLLLASLLMVSNIYGYSIDPRHPSRSLMVAGNENDEEITNSTEVDIQDIIEEDEEGKSGKGMSSKSGKGTSSKSGQGKGGSKSSKKGSKGSSSSKSSKDTKRSSKKGKTVVVSEFLSKSILLSNIFKTAFLKDLACHQSLPLEVLPAKTPLQFVHLHGLYPTFLMTALWLMHLLTTLLFWLTSQGYSSRLT